MSEAVEVPIKEESVTGVAEMVDITSLTEAERDKLTADIKKTSGAVQIWVHSHFGRQSWEDDESDIEKFGQYAIDREKLIYKTGTSQMPVIAFVESSMDFDPDKTAIQEHAKFYGRITDKPVYYVRTIENSPTPSLGEKERSNPHQDLHPEKDKENWNKVTQLFKSLGVSQAIVSGMYYQDDPFGHLYEEEPLLPASYRLISGCVNSTIAQLKERGIKTYLSKVTYPDVKSF